MNNICVRFRDSIWGGDSSSIFYHLQIFPFFTSPLISSSFYFSMSFLLSSLVFSFFPFFSFYFYLHFTTIKYLTSLHNKILLQQLDNNNYHTHSKTFLWPPTIPIVTSYLTDQRPWEGIWNNWGVICQKGSRSIRITLIGRPFDRYKNNTAFIVRIYSIFLTT